MSPTVRQANDLRAFSNLNSVKARKTDIARLVTFL